MKKSYFYFIVPIAALVLFWVFYSDFSKSYQDKKTAEIEHKNADLKKKREEDAQAREKAMQDAIAHQVEIKTQRDERDRQVKKQSEERDALVDARDRANIEAVRLKSQADRLNHDITDAQEAIKKINEEKGHQLAEVVFLRQYVKKTEANANSLTDILNELQAADDAAKAAAAKH